MEHNNAKEEKSPLMNSESETVEAKMGIRITPESDARMNYVVKEINKLAGPREELHEQAKTYWREWIEEARDDWPSIVPISLMFDFAAAFASSLLQEKERERNALVTLLRAKCSDSEWAGMADLF